MKRHYERKHSKIKINGKNEASASQQSVVPEIFRSFKYQTCRLLLAKLVVMDNQPFTYTENPDFRELVDYLKRDVHIPKGDTLKGDILHLYDLVEEQIKILFKDKNIAISQDAF
jgi:hypothetical protein